MDIKLEIKEEPSCSQNEGELLYEDLENKVKIETVVSSTECYVDIKTEIQEEDLVCNFSSQSEAFSEHPVERFNKSNKDGEILGAQWCLEGTSTETAIIYDNKDETNEDFYSIKSPSIYKERVSSYTPELPTNEDIGSDISFNINKDYSECESGRKCQSQESVVTDVETSVCSETSDGHKVVSLVSCLKQSKLLQQSSTNKHNINKENCKSILSHDYRKSYKCDVSGKNFKCSHELVHDRKECDVWDKGLNELSTHKVIDEDKKVHKCNICNKGFSAVSKLKRHILIHEGKKPHKCNVCNKDFTELSGLKRHKLIHLGIKPHRCNICNKSFTELHNLKIHILIHEGIKPHKCNICDKVFTQLQNLKMHKSLHEGIKQHRCNICNKTFSRSEHLKTHKVVHEGIKPYICNICNKAFTQSSSLNVHKLIHVGAKPHKCNICNKTFTQSSSLNAHKLIHVGVKPHKCNICNRAFTKLFNLKRHSLVHEQKNS